MNSTIKKLIRKLKMYNNKKNMVHSVEPLSLSLSIFIIHIFTSDPSLSIWQKKEKTHHYLCPFPHMDF